VLYRFRSEDLLVLIPSRTPAHQPPPEHVTIPRFSLGGAARSSQGFSIAEKAKHPVLLLSWLRSAGQQASCFRAPAPSEAATLPVGC
jgi:hypothetical protein